MHRIIKFILLKIGELGALISVPWVSFLIASRWFGERLVFNSFFSQWLIGFVYLVLGAAVIFISIMLVVGIIFLIIKNWEWAGKDFWR